MHPTTAAAVATSSGRCTLDRDELSTCWLASPRGNLVAEQRRDTQRSEYTVERLCVDVVAPALDARDLAVARACPLGDFLLREPKLRPQVDEHLGDLVSTRELRLRSAIGGAPGASASSAFLSGLADGTGHRLLQSAELIRFDKSGQGEERVGRLVGGASWPAARGGTRLVASIRALNSAKRCCAMVMSVRAIGPRYFSRAWSRTKRFFERW